VQQLQLTPPKIQERVTMRDQTIDAVTRGLPGTGRKRPSGKRAARLMTHPSSTGGQRPVRIVEPQQVRGWLRDVRPQAMRRLIQGDGEGLPVLEGEVCDDVTDDLEG
jgi:hypothetical protein